MWFLWSFFFFFFFLIHIRTCEGTHSEHCFPAPTSKQCLEFGEGIDNVILMAVVFLGFKGKQKSIPGLWLFFVVVFLKTIPGFVCFSWLLFFEVKKKKKKIPTRACEETVWFSWLSSCWGLKGKKSVPGFMKGVRFSWLLKVEPKRESVSSIVQELCESRGGRPGLSVLTSLTVSVDVKLYRTVLTHWSQLVPNMSTDIRGH